MMLMVQVETEEGELVGYISLLESGTMEEEAKKMAEKLKKKAAKQGKLKPLELKVQEQSIWE